MSDGVIRVVVADHQYLVREGVKQLLELEPDLQVVARVGTPEELLAVIQEVPVDVVITDIKMPPTHRTEGIEAAHRIRATHPSIGVVVLSALADAVPEVAELRLAPVIVSDAQAAITDVRLVLAPWETSPVVRRLA